MPTRAAPRVWEGTLQVNGTQPASPVVLSAGTLLGIGTAGHRGFNEELRRAWAEGRVPRLFTDEFRSPIAAVETARAVWQLIRAGARGVFHVAGAERLSRWQIGQLLAARWPQLQPRLEPASLREYRGAPRPPDTSLDCTRAEAVLGWRLPRFREWLAAQPAGVF